MKPDQAIKIYLRSKTIQKVYVLEEYIFGHPQILGHQKLITCHLFLEGPSLIGVAPQIEISDLLPHKSNKVSYIWEGPVYLVVAHQQIRNYYV